MLTILRLGQTTLAAATVLHVPGQRTGYCHYIARDEQAVPCRYSVGKIILCQVIRWAMQRKIAELNLAYGTVEYKKYLGGSVYAQHDFHATPGWQSFRARWISSMRSAPPPCRALCSISAISSM